MINKKWTIILISLLALAVMAIPTAQAACGDAAVPGVNWANCDKSGENLNGADLSGADLTNANLSGANLNMANLAGAILDGTDLSDANLNGVDMTGATGVPIYNDGGNWNNVTCPDGSDAADDEPYCDWAPLAVTLVGTGAMTVSNLWPWAVAGLLLVAFVLLLLVRRKKEATLA